jgi:TonB family protein
MKALVHTAAIGAITALAIPADAAKPPAPLAWKGPWQLDYAPDSCLLGRRFVDGDGEVALGLRALPLEESVELIVTRPTGDDRFRLGEAEVTLASGARETASFESFPTTKPGFYTTRMRLPAEMFAAAKGDDVLTIAARTLRPVAFQLSGFVKVMAAFATCNDDTLKTWGVDPAERQRAATPPAAVDDRSQWIRASDYPSTALRERRQGTTVILFRIGTEGRVDQCRAVVTSGAKELDDAACAALTKRGRYTSARDASGQPMPVHRVRRVTWRLPGTWNARS